MSETHVCAFTLGSLRETLRVQRGTTIAKLPLAVWSWVLPSASVTTLPYTNADRLVRILQNNPGAENVQERRAASLNQEHFLQWRARTRTLSHLAVFERQAMTLAARAESTRLPGARVSSALFPMLGASPEIGRGFDDADERPGGPPVVVLSHLMWQRYFGLDPAIVGRTISLDGRPHAVAGVMPASFEFPDKGTLFWTPVVFTPPVRIRDGGEIVMVQAIGRVPAVYLLTRRRRATSSSSAPQRPTSASNCAGYRAP